MTTIVLIGALAAALLAAAGAVVAVWRARRAADARVADAVAKVAAGMHDTMRELAGAVEAAEAARTAPRPVEPVTELAASLDLEDVTERTLEAIVAVPGVDAALIDAGAPDGGRLLATVGMTAEEASGAAVTVPTNEDLRALEVTYRYRLAEVEDAPSILRSAAAFPLRAEGGEQIGTLSAFSRSPGRPLDEGELDAVERIALRAGPALDNARRYAEARALADLDALTALHNRRYFHETLAREVGRAHRYQRRLAIVVLDLDDFKTVNDRVGHLAGDAVLAETAERLLSVVRSADVPCRIGGDEFAVVLPESGGEDAELLAGRIARAIGTRPIGPGGTLSVSAGVAELQLGDRPSDLFERADEALFRAKELGKARTVSAGGMR